MTKSATTLRPSSDPKTSHSKDRLGFGAIIFARVTDSSGHQIDDHTALVVTDDAEIAPGGTIVVAGVTSREDTPRPESYIKLKHHQDPAKSPTGLVKPSWAVCNWLIAIPVSDVRKVIGHLGEPEMSWVMKKVNDHLHRSGIKPSNNNGGI